MKKSENKIKRNQEEGERERRRARSERLPEPEQNQGYWAQFARQESSTEEESLSSEEEAAESRLVRVEPTEVRPQRAVPLPSARRGLGLAVREALVLTEYWNCPFRDPDEGWFWSGL